MSNRGGGACNFTGKYSVGEWVGKNYRYKGKPGQCNPKGVYLDNARNRANCSERIGQPYRIGNACAIKSADSLRNNDVHVAKSLNPNAGRGLFAARDFRSGENVADLEGTLKSIDKAPEDHVGYLIYWSEGTVLDTLDGHGKSLGRFANATYKDPMRRKANVKLTIDRKNQRARLKALRPIKMGQEILINYGRGFFS